MKQLPNLFTLLNLFFGCIAIIFILQNGISVIRSADGTQLIDMPEQIWFASLFIGLAAIVDFVDGFIARMFKVSSLFGKQLDSLADVISFGVAPGMILYQFLRMSMMRESNAVDTSMWWLMPALIVPCAAAFRLARFNIDDSQQYGFKGMPTPAVGLLVASFPLIYWNSENPEVVKLMLNKWVLYLLVVALSWLMVSRLPLMAMKFKNFSLQYNLPKILLVAVTIAAAFFLKWLAVPVCFLFYIILSLAFKNKTT
jgi:CDP-diacylglycerol---serine O-phosphatidyltransferase